MKRNEPTIVVKATQTVDGFAKVYKMLQQQIVLRGQSKSTLENYIRRIVLTLIYSAGLRSQEAINLKISDIDFERKTIYIRQSKYKKDRMVPLSEYIAKGLRKYFSVEHPYTWIFNGKEATCHTKSYLLYRVNFKLFYGFKFLCFL